MIIIINIIIIIIIIIKKNENVNKNKLFQPTGLLLIHSRSFIDDTLMAGWLPITSLKFGNNNNIPWLSPTPRRGSHVKSGKTHTQSSKYTP